jgi:hypothetical protein
VNLRVCAIAQHILARLHRRIGEVLPAILRHDRTPDERDRDHNGNSAAHAARVCRSA